MIQLPFCGLAIETKAHHEPEIHIYRETVPKTRRAHPEYVAHLPLIRRTKALYI